MARGGHVRTRYLSVVLLCLLPLQAAGDAPAEDRHVLAGNTYDVLMLCLGQAGTYARGFGLQSERFVFSDTGAAVQLGGLEHLPRTATVVENGGRFAVQVEARDEFEERYRVGIKGVSVLGVVLVGVLTVEFAEFDDTGWAWHTTHDIKAPFVAFAQ